MPTQLSLADRLVLLACAAFLVSYFWLDGGAYPPPPDFANMPVEERKQVFFDYLSPIVADINAELTEQSDRLRELRDRHRSGERIGWSDRNWLRRIARRFDVSMQDRDIGDVLQVLYRRAGIIPESIVLAQAAIESGWGTSRFALLGNNYFGQRCYRENCGITPSERPDGSFGLAAFASVAASIESYMLNLNIHEQYQAFRALRLELRASEQPISGLALIDGLQAYSERGDNYVAEVEDMILSNDLE